MGIEKKEKNYLPRYKGRILDGRDFLYGHLVYKWTLTQEAQLIRTMSTPPLEAEPLLGFLAKRNLLPKYGSFLPQSVVVSSLCSDDAFDSLPGSAVRVDGARGATKRGY